MNPILARLSLCFVLAATLCALRGDAAVTVTENLGLPPGDLSLEGQDVVVEKAVLTLSGVHRFRSLRLVQGAVLNHPAAPGGESDHAVRLILTEGLTVDASSRVDASGLGYARPDSPGAGKRGSFAGGGGGHGGIGSGSAGAQSGPGGAAFGSVVNPGSWGGPGGPGGTEALAPGGGWISIEAGGEMVLEGVVQANGAQGTVDNQGGGAGGSILLQCSGLRGAGVIRADGGNGEWVDGGGGAGGRIAVVVGNNQFAGTYAAVGGGGAGRGGAGTVYLKPVNGVGEVRVQNLSRGARTPLDAPVPFHLVLSANALVHPSSPLDLAGLRVGSDAALLQAPGTTGLVVRVSGDAVIEANGVLSADGAGHPVAGNRGPGAPGGAGGFGAGGGHGGWGGTSRGGASGGEAYGSILQPVAMGSQGADGSGGAGGAGGGLVRLTVGGTLTVAGRCSADGHSGVPDNAGGGAGGSLWVDAAAFAGEGLITANGGVGEWVDGGGGAGGRIALYTRGTAFPGRVMAQGGGGFQRGGAGTVYVRQVGAAEGWVRVDNGGTWGNQTPLRSPEAFRLVLTNRAACYAENPLHLAELVVAPDAVVTHLTGQTNLEIHVAGDLTIAAGGQVVADGKGYPVLEDRGPGMGVALDGSGSGGGHGGLGGHGRTGSDGGGHYGSLATPTSLGSQGGTGSGGAGAAGGGAIRLVVGGRLLVDGRLSAEGLSAGADNAGGGAGGSLWLTVGSLTGTGTVSANGGAGEWVDGGGGAGGRISVTGGTGGFTGVLSAWGGGGRERGGAGTIYQSQGGGSTPAVLVDNGGTWGNYTPLEAPFAHALTLAGRAYAYPVGPLTLQSLDIRTNATLTQLASQTNLSLRVLGNLTVHDGGALDVDGRGPGRGDASAPGAGSQEGCCGSGGGHGGLGAIAAGGAPGGVHNDSLLEPVLRGSPGGAGNGGGGYPGGGAVRLMVDGTMLLNGRVTANGLSSTLDNSGGGAGGSLWITAESLAGSGVLTAHGGAGEWVEGGGGGGGRIALYYGESTFSGELGAMGGGGARRGGAGTVYQRRSGSVRGTVRIDNGGLAGHYTPLGTPEAFDLVLAGRAHVYPEGALTLHTLEVGPTAILTHLVGQPRCEVHVLDALTVAAGGVVTADGRGYPVGGDAGPGAGLPYGNLGSGGGHGGRGGSAANGGAGGLPYGSYTDPDTAGSQGGPGSGGAGAAGGGVIRLKVDQVFTLEGRLSAIGLNAGPDNAGGGAGGTVNVTAGTLRGGGEITVDGGSGEWVDGGGGAGGRVALRLGRNAFTGTLTTRGGGARFGGAGTLYTLVGEDTVGTLVLDNGGRGGALSPLSVPPSTRVVLAGGSTLHPVGDLEVVSLRLLSGATLTHTNGQAGLTVRVAEDFQIEAGATLTASGKGYPVGADPGPGAGTLGSAAGSGGGHGGEGGVALPGDVPGGPGYGSILEPTALGSSGAPGGGNAANPRTPGGGAIRILTGGTLTLDGSIVADGTTAWADNQGGAAGGSIWITAGSLAGTGDITANGGSGEWVDGGGGAGGRIALHLGNEAFAGRIQAAGGGGRQVGGAGSIYRRIGEDPVGSVRLDNGGRWGAYTPLVTEEPFNLLLTNRAQAYPRGPLVLGTLTTTTETVLTHLKGQEAFSAVVLGDAVLGGVLDVNGRGYPVGVDRGPGAGALRDWAGSGAGHGGSGGASRTGQPGGLDYGTAAEPIGWGSQGGSGSGGPGGHGGGSVRLVVGGTLTLDGAITADGLNGTADNAGGGSGGSILLSARSLSGAGILSAVGGGGEWVDGGGGSGGRIAVYRTADSFTGTVRLGGGGGFARGSDGTLHQGSISGVVWLGPAAGWVDGQVPLEVAFFAGSEGAATVDFLRWRDGVSVSLGRVADAVLTAGGTWDTTTAPDGAYDLEVVVSDAAGKRVASSRRPVLVQNAVAWHGGWLPSHETWTADRIHVVRRDLLIPNGVTLTLEPGVVVKFLPGVRLTLQSGGGLASGGTAAQPVHLTSFLDDATGGDSNLDGEVSRAQPGSWRLEVSPGAVLDLGDHTRIRYHSQAYGGTLTADAVWSAESLREISENVVVPSGVTLRIEAGAIVKFASGRGLDIQAGGALVVAGTAAQPVVFTSNADDAFAGDSNADGSRTVPAAGDWRSLRFADGAQGTLDHALIRYGGNSVGNPWGAGGAIEALGGGLTVRNSVLSDALKDGAFCYGSTRFENCLVLRCDRGLTAVGTMEVVNCTIDSCRIGLLEHVGQLNVRNTLVTRSLDVGIEHDLGGGVPLVTHCNVWNPGASRGNYHGVTDRTGTEGNLSAAPRFRDPDHDNFRLNFASPGIDAADGGTAPPLDFGGVPRYDDPRTGNTGIAAANGAVPDIGAFEFAETAPSNLDLAVADVNGPSTIVAGETVEVEWTVINRGAEAFTGPWHDAVFLQQVSTGARLPVSEPLVGRSVTLGPGQVFTATANVRIPGGVADDYRWVVEANSRSDVFEGANSSNNTGLSAGASSLSVPVLPLDGAPVPAAFAAQEESHWFRVAAPPGKDVRVTVDLLGEGVTEVYVGSGFVPTPENYSARQREFAAADTTAVGPGASIPSGSTVYVLVIGRVLPALPAGFRVSATTAPFAIESVANGPVGNSGEVTLELHGTGFTPATGFTLRSGDQVRPALRQSVREPGRAFATFDLTGVPAGPADVSAGADGVTTTLSGAVGVAEGGTGDFHVTLSGPSTTRAGRFTTWFVTYGNRGRVDVRLPLLRVRAPGAAEFQVFDNTLNWADSMTFLALNPDVLLPTLGPGQETTFQVRIRTVSAVSVSVEVLRGEEFAVDASPFAWSSLGVPAGADPAAWNAMIASLPARFGLTAGEYHRVLEGDLEEIRADPTRYTYLANVNGRWLFGDEPEMEPEERPIIELPPQPDEGGAAPGLQGKPAKIPGDGIRKTWWVVVQIKGYDSPNINDLENVEADFRDIGRYLIQDLRVPTNQIVGGIDRRGPNTRTWNRASVLQAIASLKGKVDADDNVVISYSGHGGKSPNGNAYMCLNGDNLSPVAFQQAIDEVGAGTTYLINDSCHSEGFNNRVQPANTTFVGFAGSKFGRVAWDDPNKGGYLLSGLKARLRKCNGLGDSMDFTTQWVSNKFAGRAQEKHRQEPVLTNPAGASLEGKPWNDPSGFEQILRQRLNALAFHPWTASFLNIVGSVDPNEKHALAGAGPEHWVQPSQVLPFEVLFENKTNAAAAAQEVLVVDDLDPGLDWSTLEFTSIAFNNTRISIPAGHQRFTTKTQVPTDIYPVEVELSLNPVSGRISCLLRSVDPATGELPEDPFAGFLPPNDATRRGEGAFTYTVRPRPGLVDGTILTNRATIIFDPTYGANPPIVTPVATNTLDGLPPSSTVAPLPSQAVGEIPIQWSGQDAPGGSGVASYDIYVARDQEPYQPWRLATTETQARFLGEPGSTYRFYSIARDLAGNTESAPIAPDATLTVGGGGAGPVSIAFDGSRVRVSFTQGVLQSAPALLGPWTDVPNATSPLVLAPSGTAQFFRTRR